MKYFLFYLLFAISSICQAQHINDKTSSEIDNLCLQTFKEGNFPGMAVVVAIKDSIIWSRGYGYADMEGKKPIDPQSSIFRIGSISKTLTAAGLAQLIEKKKIDLDRPVQDYVPYFPMKQYPVTVRNISCHTGGIRHYNGMEFMSNKEYKDVVSGIAIFKDSDLNFVPGSQYSYSSYGWNLVSAVMEGGSGESFRKYMQENVFTPLHMDNTYAESEALVLDDQVSYYMHDNNGIIQPAYSVNNSYKWAGGGFISTAEDMVKFSHGIQENKLYNVDIRNKFWTSCTLNDGSVTNYGLGWATNLDDDGRRWVGHSGGSVGGTSMYLLYPEEGLTVITLVNLSNAGMNRLAWNIADLLED